MPTHTPSPKRFLVSRQPSAKKTHPKPPSSLRNAYTIQTPGPVVSAPEHGHPVSEKVTAVRRFVIAPHRHVQGTEYQDSIIREAEAQVRHQAESTPRPRPRRKLERVESIEEPLRSSPDEPSYDDRGIGVMQTAEHGDDEETCEEQEDGDDEILFVTEERNKRRRISPPTSPSTHQSSEPATPVTIRTHRFVVPSARTPAPFAAIHDSAEATGSASVVVKTIQTPHRPAFILPPQPTSPPKPSRPLLEIFSPSRKTQKYVPNGLASTMQAWIIEAANTGFAAQERSATGDMVLGRDREDGIRLRLRVTAASSSSTHDSEEVECYPGHFVFVRGRIEPGVHHSLASDVLDNDSESKILLASKGGARGVATVKIKAGSIVGVRAPMWDVEVGGETWMVGVDWTVL